MNLLIVDYGQLVAAVACIAIVPFNTPFVAKCLAQFIDAVFTLRKDIDFSKFHIVSFSMGTLCAGQLHQYLTIGEIPRITG